MAEALLLAQCGDQALWQKTQSAFFERQNRKYPFLTILYAIIRNEMMDLVLKSDLSKWKETLALLSTYGKSDEFPSMCEALAGRLETERRDLESATLCYMCAANVPRVVAFWTAELKQVSHLLNPLVLSIHPVHTPYHKPSQLTFLLHNITLSQSFSSLSLNPLSSPSPSLPTHRPTPRFPIPFLQYKRRLNPL